MPSTATLEAFVCAVEGGAHAQAIQDYYTPDATMRGNQAEPRRGRDVRALTMHAIKAALRARAG